MPTGTSYRGSTQDGSSGVQVAQATTEVTGSGTLCIGVSEGNKTTYAEVQQTNDAGTTSITAANAPTGGNMTATGFGTGLTDCGNALNVQIRASCDTASATLSGRLALYSADATPIFLGWAAEGRTFTFTSDATLRLGNATGNFVCGIALADIAGARSVRFKVDAVSAGTWAVMVRPV